MDETAIQAQYKPQTTAHEMGSKTRPKDIPHTEIRATALAILYGNGIASPLVFIKKGKTSQSLNRWENRGVLNVPRLDDEEKHPCVLDVNALTDVNYGLGYVSDNARMTGSLLCRILTQVIAPQFRMALQEEGVELQEHDKLGYVLLDSDKSHKTEEVKACFAELKLEPIIMTGKGGVFLDPLDRKIYGIVKAKLKASEQDDVCDWHVEYFERILDQRDDPTLADPDPHIQESGMVALDSSIVRVLKIWHDDLSSDLVKNAFRECYTFMEDVHDN